MALAQGVQGSLQLPLGGLQLVLGGLNPLLQHQLLGLHLFREELKNLNLLSFAELMKTLVRAMRHIIAPTWPPSAASGTLRSARLPNVH